MTVNDNEFIAVVRPSNQSSAGFHGDRGSLSLSHTIGDTEGVRGYWKAGEQRGVCSLRMEGKGCQSVCVSLCVVSPNEPSPRKRRCGWLQGLHCLEVKLHLFLQLPPFICLLLVAS